MPDLLCPKCRVPMTTVERSGQTIEHCPDCGGVFLDRGELERLEIAEAPGLPTTTAPPRPPSRRPGAGRRADEPRPPVPLRARPVPAQF
jgi:Zn-finger nucleic acid-binding protein